MIIQKIRIKNFRGFRESKTIDFSGKSFILLSAPNGMGKTSLIDAIEWCLTGDIGRLKSAYKNRSTNSSERKRNLDGIIKNKNADSNELIEVELTFLEEDEEYKIRRTQKKDELDAASSEVVLNESKERAQVWLKENVGNNFYEYHFCDVQKSFEMQNKKRDSLPEMFEEFISDYSKEKAVAKNLETFAEDIGRSIEGLKAKEVSKDEIDDYQIRQKRYKEKISVLDYPQVSFFPEEILQIEQLSEEMLIQQLQTLYSYGYFVAYNKVDSLIKDISIKSEVSKLEKMRYLLFHKKNEIKLAMKYGLDLSNDVIAELSKKIADYEKIKIDKNNITTYVDLLVESQSGDYTREYYEYTIGQIKEKEIYISKLDQEIEHLTKGNDVLGILTELVTNREAILDFRNLSEKCPICGSKQFTVLDDNQVLFEANEYIKKNDEVVMQKKKEKKQVLEKVEEEYKKFILCSQQTLERIISEKRAHKAECERIKNDTVEYFELMETALNMSGGFTKENLTTLEYVDDKISEMKLDFLSEEERTKRQQEYKSILTIIGYNFEGEEERVTAERIKSYIGENVNISNFQYTVFAQKVNSIKSILDNNEYLDINEKLKNALEKNAQVEKERESLIELKEKAEKRSERIQQLVSQLEKDEYAEVGPSLKRYYKKLARIETLDTIDIVSEDGLISVFDEKKKNIVNILSNGQLSVFMLSYFFAAITTRSKTEKCKIYFIDDLTACMDDINMLSFLDLLKYQMLSKENNMEQIFFATCDSKICNLLGYKLKGSNIDYCELSEKAFL